jgi:tripartite-type tricarboxylate transporter receptor subunit TctC
VKTTIRNSLATGLFAVAVFVSATAAAQQGKVIKFLVPFPPGGGADLTARLIAPRLADKLAQPVVVENRVGASGNTAMEAVAKAEPDGLTIALAFTGITINPVLDPGLRYNTLNDFAPITKVADNTLVLVANPSFSAKNLIEVLAQARRSPGQITYGSAGTGTSMHLMGELIGLSGNVKMLHIPYKGNAPLVNDLLGGQIPLAISDLASTTSFIKSGRLRAIAVGSAKRSILAPDIPTVAEAALPGFSVLSWTGVVAPSGTPSQLVHSYSAYIGEILSVSAVREKLMAIGLEPAPTTPEEFAAIIRSDLGKWGRTIKATGLKAE